MKQLKLVIIGNGIASLFQIALIVLNVKLENPIGIIICSIFLIIMSVATINSIKQYRIYLMIKENEERLRILYNEENLNNSISLYNRKLSDLDHGRVGHELEN